MSVQFLTTQLGSSAQIIVEVAWGANLNGDSSNWTWTDITSDVRQADGQQIVISPMGRSDGFGQAQPAGCTFQLKNQAGAYTPNNPQSSNYPNVKRNTPIRVQVTLNGITKYVRFFGYANGFTPGWDPSGRAAIVTVSASGTLRRLLQGTTPIRSALTRAILKSTAATLRQYWPCEDQSNATQAASAFTGGAPLTVAGTVQFAAMNWLTQTDFTVLPGTTFGTQPLPLLKSGGSLSATFPAGSSSAWTIQASIFCNPIVDDTTIVLFQWAEGGRLWQVTSDGITADSVSLKVNGSTIASQPNIMINEDVRIDAAQSGGNINWSFKPMLAHTAITGSFAGTLAGVTSFSANPNGTTTSGSLSVGHVRVWDGNTAANFKTSTLALSAWNGYNGEIATDRLTRICGEEGLGMPLALTGSASNIVMGTQPVDTLLNVLRECETADGGLLYDGLSQGLGYITRAARYNQSASMTVDANSGQIPSGTVAPVDDDQRNRNLVIAQRTNGAAATYQDSTGPLGTGTNGIGVYDTTITLNLFDDSGLADQAAWLVHLGTVDGLRYPTFTADFAGAPELASTWVTTTLAERVDITNISSQLLNHPVGTVSLLLEGYTEVLSRFRWQVSANCSPYRPWEVFQVADSRLGRLDTDGSYLASSESTSDTSFTVASNPGPVWDTAATPFDLDVEGEQVTATAVANAATDAFGRTVSNGFGTADSGQTYTLAGGSASDFSVSTGTGRIASNTRNVERFAIIDVGSTDVTVQVDAQFGVGTPTGSTVDIELYGRLTSSNNGYLADLSLLTTGIPTLSIWKDVAGTFTQLTSAPSVSVNNLGDVWRISLSAIGTSLSATARNVTTGAAPVTVMVTDSSITTGTRIGLVHFVAPTNTNTLPVTGQFDNLAVSNPQTFTVTRSVNGVVKAHSSGAVVKLWRPGVLAL